MSSHPTIAQGSVIDALKKAIEHKIPNSRAEVKGGGGHFTIEVTSAVQIVPQVGTALGDAVILTLMGYSYERNGPDSLWSYVLALSVSLVLVTIVMQLFGFLHGDRFEEK